MTENENQNILYTQVQIIYMIILSEFLPIGGFKWIGPKEFDLNKYTSNSSTGCVLEVDLEYPKQFRRLDIGYPLAPEKIEIKEKTLQLKIANLYNIPIGSFTKLVPIIFHKEKYELQYQNLQLYLRPELKLKKVNCTFEFNQSQWLKPYAKFN